MLGQDVYTPLVQLLKLELRYMVNDKILLARNALCNIYALTIHNI